MTARCTCGVTSSCGSGIKPRSQQLTQSRILSQTLVSMDTDDPALSQQTLAQVMLACTQAVGNISIIRSDHKRKQLPKNLSSAQLALSHSEEVGQSRTEKLARKKV